MADQSSHWDEMRARWQAGESPGTEQRQSPYMDSWERDPGEPSVSHAAAAGRRHRTHGANVFGTIPQPSEEFLADNPAGRDDTQDAYDDDESSDHMAANPQSPSYATPGGGIGQQWAATGIDGFKQEKERMQDPVFQDWMDMPLLDAVMSGSYRPAPEAITKAAAAAGAVKSVGGQAFTLGLAQHMDGAANVDFKPHGQSGHEVMMPHADQRAADFYAPLPVPVAVVAHADLRGACRPSASVISDAHSAARAAAQPDANAPTGRSRDVRGPGYDRPGPLAGMQTSPAPSGNRYSGLTRPAPGER
jgi:hypothetical protein